MLRFSVEKFRIHLQRLLQVERSDSNQTLRLDLAVLAAKHSYGWIDFLQAPLDGSQLRLLDEVSFVEQDPVCEGHLLHGFVLDSLWAFLVQALDDILRISYGDDAVEIVH
jgi:hypothetical protein